MASLHAGKREQNMNNLYLTHTEVPLNSICIAYYIELPILGALRMTHYSNGLFFEVLLE